ncbi:MAG: thioredoxin family protein, partial [Treponema sp.]|nr:thioredoxin family protein [Treponema sp.]
MLFLFASCRKKTVWQTDYDAALQDAKTQGKDVFVLFSGEDWDGKTTGFRTEVLDTEEFSAFVKDKYVLLNIDLSEAEQANAIAAADADDQAKADAARLQSSIDAKNAIIQRYSISSYPTVCILSNEGYVLSFIQYNEGLNSPSVLMEVLDELAPAMADVSAAIRQVQLSAGAEKVRAID